MVQATERPKTKFSQSVDLVEILEREVYPRLSPEQVYNWAGHNFKRSGNRLRGNPPWGQSKSGTSFTAFDDLGFLDSHNGNESGDPIKYLYSLKTGGYAYPKGKDWLETVKELFLMAGVTFPEREWTPQQIKHAQRREARQAILKAVETYCADILWTARGEASRKHLIEDRGFTPQGLKDFGIGLYPTVKEIKQVLQAKKLDIKLAQQIGVLANKWEGYMIFPWANPYSQPLTLYGHQTKAWAEATGKPKKYALFNPKDEEGAWLHTKESPYLLNRAIRVRHKELVLVEGITDAAIAHQQGDTRVIACVAAMLSKQQCETLKRHRIERVIIALDPDAAGDAGIDSCIKSLSGVGISAYVAPKLPDGLDPDEFLLKQGIEAWNAHTAQAIHGYRWKAERILESGDLTTDSGKEAVLKQVIAYMRSQQDLLSLCLHFTPSIANGLGIDVETLKSLIELQQGDNNTNSGDNSDDGNSNQPNRWNAPVSWNGEIGWLVPIQKPVMEINPETGKQKPKLDSNGQPIVETVLEFYPKCNFDFQIEQELSSVDTDDGGGLVLQVKRSIDPEQKRVIIKSIDYGCARDFELALKKALGEGIVVNLKSDQLKSLIHVRLREYRERGGRKYRLASRIGQQVDGTWVFPDKQFTRDGQPTTQEESGWVYNPHVSPTDAFASPVILDEDPKALRSLIEAQKKVAGSNFMRFLLCDGYVAACLNEQTIVKQEGFMPILNPYGDPGGGKTVATASALSLAWGTSDKSGMCSASESYLYERLSRYGSIPSLWDDPPSKRREDKEKLDELIKRNYGKFARKVRGSEQHPHSSFIPTTNHATGDTLPAAKSRIINIFFPVTGDLKFEYQPQLEDAKAKATGAFRFLITIGYHRTSVREVRARLQQHLPTSHDRAATHLAILTWYTQKVVDLAGLSIDVEDWVIKNLCPELNEAQTGLNSIADFVERFIAAKSTSAIGPWNFGLVKTTEHGDCLAIHMPSVWPAIESGDPPPYNRSVLERVLVEKGAIKNKPAKLDRDRDSTQAYQREIHKGRNEGKGWVPPSKPKPVNKKCLLIPQRFWGDLGFLILVPDSPPGGDGGKVQGLVTSGNLEVTSSNLNEVTTCEPDNSTVSTLCSLSGNLVTKKYIEEEKKLVDSLNRENFSSGVCLEKLEPLKNLVTGLPKSVDESQSLENTEVESVTHEGYFEVTRGDDEVTSTERVITHDPVTEIAATESQSEAATEQPLDVGSEVEVVEYASASHPGSCSNLSEGMFSVTDEFTFQDEVAALAGVLASEAICPDRSELATIRRLYSPAVLNAACKRLSIERHAQIKQWVIELNEVQQAQKHLVGDNPLLCSRNVDSIKPAGSGTLPG